MLVGYGRISTHAQTLALQQDALQKGGCEQIFVEAGGENPVIGVSCENTS